MAWWVGINQAQLQWMIRGDNMSRKGGEIGQHTLHITIAKHLPHVHFWSIVNWCCFAHGAIPWKGVKEIIRERRHVHESLHVCDTPVRSQWRHYAERWQFGPPHGSQAQWRMIPHRPF